MKQKWITRYQIYNIETGDYVLDAYCIKESAEYMSKYLNGNYSVLEIEIEL